MADDKRLYDRRRYAVLPKETVQMFAEAAGLPDLSDDLAAGLAEDVVYKLREVLQTGCQFMKHSRRKQLTVDDFNKALKHSDVQPILGHSSSDALAFKQTKEGELSFIEDLEIDLANIACSSHDPKNPGEITVKGKVKLPKPISEHLLQYYELISKAITGNEEEVMKFAVEDLRTNPKIGPALPYFVNFISNGVKTVSHDLCQLTKLLHTAQALLSNPSLYLQPRPYLSLLMQSLLNCLVEPLPESISAANDHWALRDYAARLLARIIRDFDDPVGNLRTQNLATLQKVLHDLRRPFCSHYGAVMGLLAIGTQAVEDVLLPNLPSYWSHLRSAIDNTLEFAVMRDDDDKPPGVVQLAIIRADAHKVFSAIQLAAEFVFRAGAKRVLETAVLDTVNKTGDSAEGQGAAPTSSQPPALSLAPTLHSHKLKEEPGSPAVGMEGTHPNTSTPMKGDLHVLNQSDLIGPVLQLPDHTNPYKTLLKVYTDMYEQFGDGLAVKLPIRNVTGVYAERREEVFVSLEDEDSKKSGEELLQQFLVASEEEMAQVKMKEEERSYEPTPDDLDLYDDGEERSERSSRSDRSHSDENYSLGDDTDLTVKALSDPSQGIKLTIFKRPKSKVASDTDSPMHDSSAEPMPLLKEVERKDSDQDIPKLKQVNWPKRGPVNMTDVFDVHTVANESRSFTFKMLGSLTEFRTLGNLDRLLKYIPEDSSLYHIDSELSVLGNDGKMRLRRHAQISRKVARRRRLRVLQHYSATLDMIL